MTYRSRLKDAAIIKVLTLAGQEVSSYDLAVATRLGSADFFPLVARLTDDGKIERSPGPCGGALYSLPAAPPGGAE